MYQIDDLIEKMFTTKQEVVAPADLVAERASKVNGLFWMVDNIPGIRELNVQPVVNEVTQAAPEAKIYRMPQGVTAEVATEQSSAEASVKQVTASSESLDASRRQQEAIQLAKAAHDRFDQINGMAA